MKAIITVVGNDCVGIISRVSTLLAEVNVNILDISQTTMQGVFTMMMLVDLSGATAPNGEISDRLNAIGEDLGLSIRMQKEDLFQSMHRI